MNRRMVYKTIIVFAVIIFAVILILPTFGTLTMDIFLNDNVTKENTDAIIKRFPADEFTVTKTDNKITVEAAGMKISNAVMNEAKIFQGVKDAKIRQHWAEKSVLAKKVTLGLDLQGGMDLVMVADFNKIKKQYTDERDKLLEKKKTLELQLKDSGNKDKDKIKKDIDEADNLIKDINNNRLTESGELSSRFKSEVTQQALEMLRNRVDKFGVSEPSILQMGDEAIEIQLPGVKDPAAVKNMIGTTGSVQYRLLDDTFTANSMSWLAANYKNQKLPTEKEEQEKLLTRISKDIKLPADLELLFLYTRNEQTKKIFPSEIYALQKTIALSGSDINRAWVGNDEYGAMIVQFTLSAEGSDKFAKVTTQNVGKRLAIIIDNKVRSAPRINGPIAGGSAQITGDFTVEEVNALSRIIQEGALPVDLTIAQETTVGPSLGQDTIEAGKKMIYIGIAGVMLYMLFYYKLAGLIANITLLLNFLFIFALESWLGFTLTFPGIAAVILNLGMAVDSNVIIYGRMKEELAAGKPVKVAIMNGFDRAFWAIFDSNLTTLIAAFVLSQFGTGPIKGFAVVLAIGTVSTLFVALFITKYGFELVSLKKNLKKLYI